MLKLKISNFQINFYKTLSKFEIYDTIEMENKVRIFSNFYLPISVIKTINKEQKLVDKTYSIEEAKELGMQEKEMSDRVS